MEYPKMNLLDSKTNQTPKCRGKTWVDINGNTKF